MLFGRDPRQKALLERAMKQVEQVLREMQKQGQDLAQLKIKKYQKTHYTNCHCTQCLEAQRNKNPHQRGLLEDGYKLYVGQGDAADE
jgi:hypothetical protein